MRKSYLLILILILLTGLFFRTYQIIERFEFAHDGDLYSWIVKDILVNHHPRLIGQLTSAPGIFIGPFFYYLLAPFFLLTKMDPIGVLIPVTLLGLSTIFSYYFVLSRLFKQEAGLIGAFLYATLITTVNADRWVVPTVTTSLWTIWYFYSLVMLSRGKFSVFVLLGILIGLIWHIHIALIPTLIAIPIAVLLSRKLPKFRQVFNFVASFFITSLPLIIFEIRHGFGQTTSLIGNFTTPLDGPSGFYKFQIVLEMVSRNINTLFFAPQSFNLTDNIFFPLIILSLALLLITNKLLSFKELIPLYFWVGGVILFFSISQSPISEYYFTSIGVIFIVIISLLFYLIFRSSLIGKVIIIGILLFVCLKNAYFLINQDYYNKGYAEKKEVVSFINQDAKDKDYPYIGISYITSIGENVGFRYLLYLSNIHIVHPSLDVPTYNIVIPDELALNEVKEKFGHIGVIPPTTIPAKAIVDKTCQEENTNLTDPMLGYVE